MQHSRTGSNISIYHIVLNLGFLPMKTNMGQTIIDDLKHAAQLDGHRLVGVLEGGFRLFRRLPEPLDRILPRPLLPRLH